MRLLSLVGATLEDDNTFNGVRRLILALEALIMYRFMPTFKGKNSVYSVFQSG